MVIPKTLGRPSFGVEDAAVIVYGSSRLRSALTGTVFSALRGFGWPWRSPLSLMQLPFMPLALAAAPGEPIAAGLRSYRRAAQGSTQLRSQQAALP